MTPAGTGQKIETPVPPESVMVMAPQSKCTTLLSSCTTLHSSFSTLHVNPALILTLALVFLAAAGCSASWRPIQRERIATTLRDSQPDKARVITDHSIVMVHHPHVVRDTLRGTLRLNRRVPVAIPMAAVDTLSLYLKSRAPTAVFVGGTLAFTILFLGLAFSLHRDIKF